MGNWINYLQFAVLPRSGSAAKAEIEVKCFNFFILFFDFISRFLIKSIKLYSGVHQFSIFSFSFK